MRIRIPKKLGIGLAGLLVAAGTFVGLLSLTGGSADALTVGSRRDCGYDDVIINCGALSQAELLQKYDSNNDGRGNRDIQAIFRHYGIERSDIAGTTSEVKKGWLNTNGTIVVDGKTVATNAKSLYRVRPGSPTSPVNIAGKTFYIGNVNGGYSLGADLFVFFKNGQFHSAIQASCGNPIPATPVKPPTPPKPKPVYKCESLKATKLDRTRFRFTAAATATNAQIVSYTYSFGDGSTPRTTTATTVEHTYAKPGNYTATVTINFRVDGISKSVTASTCKVTVKVEEEPKVPVYKCESLKAQKLDRTRFRFTAAASATHAEIVNYTYNFGDGSAPRTTTATTVDHEYAKPGNYTATVTVNVRVNGAMKAVTSTNCKVAVKVDEKPKEPVYKCESLKATKINRTTYRFTASALAQHGAVVENYTYNFGDGKAVTSNNSQVEHSYEKAGTYTATVTVNIKVNNERKSVTGANCKVTVKVEEEPKVPVYKCESLKAQKLDRTRFRFTASATAEHAEIVSYTFDFGNGSKRTVETATTEYEYDRPGTYSVSVTVNVRVNGEMKVAAGNNCKTTVKVKEEPVTPVYSCDLLTAKLVKDNTFAYTLEYTAEGGAELDRVVYNFGDGTTETFTAESGRNVEHTYTQPGNFTTTATLHFSVPDGRKTVEKRETCKVEIEIEKPIEVCDLTDNTIKTIKPSEFDESHMTKDLEKCGEMKVCIIEDKVVKVIAKSEYDEKTMTTDLSKCDETPEVPTELPHTGIETIVGGGIGLGSITAAGYYWAASRRSLLSALMNR